MMPNPSVNQICLAGRLPPRCRIESAMKHTETEAVDRYMNAECDSSVPANGGRLESLYLQITAKKR